MSKDGQPRIWLRESQRKVRHLDSQLSNTALCTVDVLRASHLTYPAALSVETIINFAENGVKFTVFANFMKDSMSETVDNLTTWGGPNGCVRLWHYTAKEGGVHAARFARARAAEARVQGYVFEDPMHDYADNNEDDTEPTRALEEQSSAWWWDPISGCPSSLEETSMVLLDSGFDPEQLPVLRAKQQEVAKKSIKATLSKFRTLVPMSCSAWAVPGSSLYDITVAFLCTQPVPDPCDVLDSGEIYIESSNTNLHDTEGNRTNRVVGDVLVSQRNISNRTGLTHHPCRSRETRVKSRRMYNGYAYGWLS